MTLFMGCLEQEDEVGQRGGRVVNLPLINPQGGHGSTAAAARKQQLVRTPGESARFQLIGTQFLDEPRHKRKPRMTSPR